MINKKKLVIIILTAVVILATGIITKQPFFLMIPLFVSLFVMTFQSEANRIGALIGAINAVIYTFTYLYMGVYASAASGLLFSFPVQLITFFNWKKKAYKKTVVFKRMTNKVRILFFSGIGVLWAVLAVVFYYMQYEYAVFDSLLFLLGFIVPVLTALAFVEYTYLWIVQAVFGLFLNVQMVMNDTSQATYLVYGFFALYCVILAYINVQKFYKEQRVELNKKGEQNEKLY